MRTWPELSPEGLLVAAQTLAGEARGESGYIRHCVAHVMLNRWVSGRWGDAIEGVCMAPWQFSCWNADDPNRGKILAMTLGGSYTLRQCMAVILEAMGETDLTLHSFHYHNETILPEWAKGHQPALHAPPLKFYNDVP